MLIENWCLVARGSDYTAPEQYTYHLVGNVFGHPKKSEGKYVQTSSIVGLNSDNMVLTSSGSTYELGAVDVNYEEMYPDARERLLRQIKNHCKRNN